MIINNIEFIVPEKHPIRKLAESETDKAYLAGLIDGEASVTLVKGPRIVYGARLDLEMVDKSVIKWVHQIVGAGSFGWRSRQHKQTYYIKICGYPCILVLLLILPYLKIKKRQAEILIEYQQLFGSGKRNVIYTEDETHKMNTLISEIRKLHS